MTQLSIPQAMDLALRQHRAGKLPEAEAIYRQILAVQPDHPDVLHMLGMLAFQSRQFDPAMQLIGRAIQINPRQAGYFCNLGQVLSALGRNDEAIASYRQAISISPDLPEAQNNLGNILRSQGQLDEAIACYQKVLTSRPDLPQVWTNYASLLHEKGRWSEAIEAYQRLLALTPDDPAAWNNAGNALQEIGQTEQGIEAYNKALALRPDFPEAHRNLGEARLKQKNLAAAIQAFETAIAQRPEYAEAHHSLGNALRADDQLDRAIAAHQRALQLNPAFVQAYSDLGTVLHKSGKFDEALASYDRAIELKPDHALAHFNRGLNLLLRGRYPEGLKEYEWRWRVKEFGFRPELLRTQWNGENLEGKTILLHAEQGLGDAIQFARYVSLVAGRGGRIILLCQSELRGLFRQLPGVQRVITPEEPLPEHDLQCPLMSLARIFGTSLETIPAEIPYLRADPELSSRWRERIAANPGQMKVGLVWAGQAYPDPRRSMCWSDLAPLVACGHGRFFSLQKGDAAQQLHSAPHGLDVADISEHLTDLSETAAAIDRLDLIITIDTVTAHLAGAMGKPVWTVLPRVPDWRWLLDREDSPWYPTMRLFRQSSRGDWNEPVSRIVEEIQTFNRRIAQ